MFKQLLPACLFFSTLLVADEPAPPKGQTPEQIAVSLQKAQQDFEIAQQMFIPWYTGPLIAGSANNVPPGRMNLQGYLYLTENYASFDSHRHSHSGPHTYIVNPLLIIQAGLTSWLDMTVAPQATFKWKKGTYSGNYNDTSLQFGLQAFKQTQIWPSVRFVVGELFPTGRFTHLSHSKGSFAASGAGAFQTILGLNVAKVFWWLSLHPIDVRLSTNIYLPNNKPHVKNFNAYGGGYGTDGHVKVGTTFNIDLGVEISITQRWVFATDIMYSCSQKSTFSGNKGVTSTGTTASVGAPSSDSLSLAPAIEYNVSENGGFIGGVWFSMTGRNSPNFVSIVLSYTQLF